MPTVQVFDPPMCCSTGVCGPTVDPTVVQFAADLDWLATRGVTVRRFNLAQEPASFAENAAVRDLLTRSSETALPAIVVGGAVVANGRYPARGELAAMAGLVAEAAVRQHEPVASQDCLPTSSCCSGAAPATATPTKRCC